MQESVKLARVENSGMVGNRSVAYHGRSASIVGSRHGKRTHRAQYWPALVASMIVISMVVVLGFFASISGRAAGPAIVNLGTAGNFVILAETGVSNTGSSQIWGDIGISPYAATYITGFGLVMDAGGTFSTSSLVTGSIYAADYTAPTPTMLTTAVGDMVTAYTDAAGRLNPDETELGNGDITSMTLAPGLYKWGTGVLISAAGVTLSGGASDVWIFQIAQNLEVADGAIVTLSGGAVASNVFWQVAGQATIGTTAAMQGVILCYTAIVLNTGATLVGRALAQTAVTLDGNMIDASGTMIPEFSQVLIPLIGMVFVVAIVSRVRNQRK